MGVTWTERIAAEEALVETFHGGYSESASFLGGGWLCESVSTGEFDTESGPKFGVDLGIHDHFEPHSVHYSKATVSKSLIRGGYLWRGGALVRTQNSRHDLVTIFIRSEGFDGDETTELLGNLFLGKSELKSKVLGFFFDRLGKTVAEEKCDSFGQHVLI